jgi:hypothetical protein
MQFFAYSSSGLPEKRCALNATGVCATPLDAIAQSLWLRMIRDDLLEGRTNSKLFLHN